MNVRFTGVLLLLFGFPLATAAQSSVVFLPEQLPGYSRPPSVSKPLSSPSSVQAVSPASPSDFSNINITRFLARDQNEPSIAINPTDPNNLLIGANDYRSDSSLFYYASTDGGLHWHSGPLRKNNNYAASAFNPAMVFNTNGKVFFTYGRAQTEGSPYAINDVVCFTNAGKGDSASWQGPIRIHFDSLDQTSAATFADKFYTAVDRSPGSPFLGRVYTVWVEYGANEKNHIVISHSNDEGMTWTSPLSITDMAQYQSPIPAVGPNGELYVSFLDLDTNHLDIHCTKSTDGGISFSAAANKIVSSYKNLGSIDSSGAYAHPVIKGHLRASSFPSIAVDRSSLHPGRIYLTWAGKGEDNRHHIFLSSSDDKAVTWSLPIAIEADPGTHPTDKFMPWIAVDNTNGDVGVVYYDSRNDSLNNILTDAYLLFLKAGSTSIIPLRISPVSFDPRANSTLDSTFIGDYLGLDADNKHWYPVWSDTRVGYDQDLYLAIVRPYSPSAPKNLTATEDNSTHVAKVAWEHLAVTTAGFPLESYHFKLWREDHLVDQTLPSSARDFTDVLATETKSHTYFIQVITEDGDTSMTATINYFPRALIEPLPPELLSAQAQSSGFQATIKMPATGVSGQPIIGLDKWYQFVDKSDPNSFPAKAGDIILPFFSLDDGFHKVRLAASTRLDNDDTVLSVLTPAYWLYAGSSLPSYAEDFTFGKNIFTPFAWDLTQIGTTWFINDSLPSVNYPANEDTWFVLPAVHVSDETQTLEFDHIASVAVGDSALVEFSTDDGVHYEQAAFFDLSQNPDWWKSSVTQSTPIHQRLSYKSFKDQDIVTRFRLITHSAAADGWFVGNIKYTNFLSVEPISEKSTGLVIANNPVRPKETVSIQLILKKTAIVSAAIYDLLGRKQSDMSTGKPITSGKHNLQMTAPEESGTYLLRIQIASQGRTQELSVKLIVLP